MRFALLKGPDLSRKPWKFGTYCRKGLRKITFRVGMCGLGLLAISLVAGYVVGRSQIRLLRAKAFEAVEAERPDQALPLFEEYLSNVNGDADAWRCFARCREQVAEPKQTHLVKAVEAYEVAVGLEPQNANSWIRLSKLHAGLGNSEAALKAAKQALRLEPGNSEALGLLVNAKTKNGQNSALADFVDEHGESTDWRIRLVIQDARFAMGDKPRDMLTSELDEHRQQRGVTSSSDYLLRARLALLAGERILAIETLESGLESAPQDLEFLRTVVRLGTDMQAEAVAMQYVSRFSESLNDPYLALWYARRKWESGEYEAVADALACRPVRRFATQPEANLLHFLALQRLGRNDEQKILFDRLETEADAAEVSRRWFQLIKLLGVSEQTDDKRFANVTQRVLEVNPSSPIVRLVHASVYYRQGEFALAARLSGDALRLAPSWLQLWHFHVTCLALSGQTESASKVANSMVSKFPNRFDAHLCARLLAATQLTARSNAEAAELIEWTKQVVIPKRDHRNSSLELITRLARQAVSHEGSNKEELGETPRNVNKAERALEQIQKVLAENYYYVASGSSGGMSAGIVEGISSDASKSGKVTFPSSPIESLRNTIQEPSLESISELKNQSPKGAISWRILEGKRLLKSESEREAAAAVAVLRPVVAQLENHADANLLLGLAMFRLRDPGRAIEHWYRAIQANKATAEQCLRLSLTLRKQGCWEDEKSMVTFWHGLATALSRAEEEAESASKRVEDSLLLLSAYAEETDDAALAEETYRVLLRHNGQLGIALNNLAYLLLKNGGSMDEALVLSQRSLEVSPLHREFQSTNQEVLDALAGAKVAAKNLIEQGK